MIPIRDNAATHRLAPINTALVLFNIAVFVAQMASPRVAEIASGLALVPADLSGSGTFALPSAVTLLTSIFIHAGVVHLAGNMLYLFIFGVAVEERLGHARFLMLYTTAGVFSGFAMVAIAPHSAVPIVGASGAIAGILGAYLMLCPRSRLVTFWPLPIKFGLVEVPAIVYLLIWFAIQLMEGVYKTAPGAPPGGIAWWAHIGGFLFGLALGPLLAPPPTKPARRRRRIT
jgi:membrane associated rhomboid family serine protease